MDRGLRIRESYENEGEIVVLNCYQNPIDKDFRAKNLQDALRFGYQHILEYDNVTQIELKLWSGTSNDIRPTGLRSRIRDFLIKLACMI